MKNRPGTGLDVIWQSSRGNCGTGPTVFYEVTLAYACHYPITDLPFVNLRGRYKSPCQQSEMCCGLCRFRVSLLVFGVRATGSRIADAFPRAGRARLPSTEGYNLASAVIPARYACHPFRGCNFRTDLGELGKRIGGLRRNSNAGGSQGVNTIRPSLRSCEGFPSRTHRRSSTFLFRRRVRG
jgi:hypothetical protein